MTTEEAAERILQGSPWVECLTCDGSGQVRIEGGRGTDGCQVCKSNGRHIEDDYAEACRLLDKTLPIYTSTLIKVIDFDPTGPAFTLRATL